MTAFTRTGVVASGSPGYTVTNPTRPRIGYDNIFRDGVLSASSESTPGPVENCANGFTYDSWMSTGATTEWVRSDPYYKMNPDDASTRFIIEVAAGTSTSDVTRHDPELEWGLVRGERGVSSGQWYWEVEILANSDGNIMLGVVESTDLLSWFVGQGANSYGYYAADGSDKNSGVSSHSPVYGATYTTGDVIGVALDLVAGEIEFFKNGASQGIMYSGISGTFFPAVTIHGANQKGKVRFRFAESDWTFGPPGSPGYASLTGDRAVDYCAVATHTLKGTTVTPQYSNDGTTWTNLDDAFVVPDNTPFVLEFDPVTAAYFRLYIDNAYQQVSIAAINMGSLLQMERGLRVGWSPPTLNEIVEFETPMTQGGQLLGRNIMRRGVKATVRVDPATWTWARDSWLPFVESAELYAFFIWWAQENRGEVIFGGMTDHDGAFVSEEFVGVEFTVEGINR